MAVLSLRDCLVSNIRKIHPLLKDKRVLGRGSFCRVFEGTRRNRVLKLTADRSHVQYLTDDRSPHGRFKPIVHENHGIVGQTKHGVEVHLLEIERLGKLRPGTPAFKLAIALSSYCRLQGTLLPIFKDRNKEALRNVRHLLSHELLAFMSEVNFFTIFSNCSLDMHRANFMERTDGTLVFSDPVFDKRIMLRREHW